MSSISEQLLEQSKAILGGRPLVIGGPVNDEQYWAAKPRLLFIGKDPNDGNDTSSSWQLNEYCRQRVDAIKQSNRWEMASYFQAIGVWAWGIFHGFEKFYDEVQARDAAESLNRVAVTNLKKIAGGGVANIEAVQEEALSPMGQRFLMTEIDLLAPDLVICGGSVTFNVMMKVMDGSTSIPVEELKMHSGRRAVSYLGLLAKPLVMLDFWHPSARFGGAAAYAHLKEVYRDLCLSCPTYLSQFDPTPGSR